MALVTDALGATKDIVAVHAIRPLHRAYRFTRPSTRAAVRSFYDGMRFRHESGGWSEEQKREWILQRLRYSVRRAAGETSYFRELLANVGLDPRSDFSFTDFAKLPVLEREEVRAAGDSLLNSELDTAEVRKDATGGSTGVPTEIWTGPEERGWRESGIEYFMQRIGVPAGSRTAFLWGHHLDPVARDSFGDRVRDWAWNVRWFDCLRLSPEKLLRYHGEMERWRPRCVVAYAGSLATLAEQARGLARPNYPGRCFVTGAEKLLPEQRRQASEVFGRPIHERYGGRDVGLLGFQSDVPRSLDFEIDWSTVLVEPETHEEHSAVLVTKLRADAMPMIRYRVGDIARFPAKSQPGEPALRLHEVLGREADRIWLPDGSWVHGLSFPHLMKDYPVSDFQVLQRADRSVVLRVLPRSDFTEESGRRILELVRANMRSLPVELVLVHDIPRTKSNKRRPVISEVEAERPTGGGAL
ncbi:MAG: hypothetical protein ABR543_16730 [Gemmatimonadaceae bacterium]